MKNLAIAVAVISAITLGGWYLVSSGKIKLPAEIQNSPMLQYMAPTPTSSMAPSDDIDAEMEQTDKDLQQNNPNDFNGDALLDVKLGL